MLHYDVYWLSRAIHSFTGATYTELVQQKRMRQAAYLLETSGLTVADIAVAVGYENVSLFSSDCFKKPMVFRRANTGPQSGQIKKKRI